ncbi:hypothetical protein JX266_013679 [Neoarthrinium moseri]|nr:hypothetical protein JX266_013679 [Neoarthrinium moseri]
MAIPASKCRGFTHPVVLLIRSSLQPAARPSFFTASRSPCLPSSTLRPSIRLFTTGRVLGAQIKAKPSPQALKATARVATQSPRPAATTSYEQKLAQNPLGTVLYEGAPQKLFIASSFAAGFVCLGAASLDVYFNVFNIPQGVPEWTAYAFGAVGVMLAILGTNFLLYPSSIVRSIRILPAAAEAASKSATGARGPAKVQVEVVSRRLTPIPGMPFKKEIVEPRDIVLRARMFEPKPPPTQIEQLRMRREWAERKKAQKEYDDEHRMTIPFRDAKWAVSTIFSSIRKGLTGEGFVPIEVKGKKYKLDLQDGYVFEEGRALDRLVRIEPDEKGTPMLLRKA